MDSSNSSSSDSENDFFGNPRHRSKARLNAPEQKLENKDYKFHTFGYVRGAPLQYYFITVDGGFKVAGIMAWMDEIMKYIAIPNVPEIHENLKVFYEPFYSNGTTHFRHQSNRLYDSITRLVVANPPETPYILQCVGSIFWNALAYILYSMILDYKSLKSDEKSIRHTYRTMMRLTNTLLDRVMDDMKALLPNSSSLRRLPLYRGRQTIGSVMRRLRKAARESSNVKLRMHFLRLDLILSIVMMYLT